MTGSQAVIIVLTVYIASGSKIAPELIGFKIHTVYRTRVGLLRMTATSCSGKHVETVRLLRFHPRVACSSFAGRTRIGLETR
jgi:hypothetical protein